MTPRQRRYAEHRAAGYGQVQAAKAAGYSEASARISATANERNPVIKAAIEEARGGAKKTGDTGARFRGKASREYRGAQEYLLAVVRGEVPADPARISAARGLLPFLEPRRRSPKGNAISPREQEHLEELEAEGEASEAWQATVDRIKARMEKEK